MASAVEVLKVFAKKAGLDISDSRIQHLLAFIKAKVEFPSSDDVDLVTTNVINEAFHGTQEKSLNNLYKFMDDARKQFKDADPQAFWQVIFNQVSVSEFEMFLGSDLYSTLNKYLEKVPNADISLKYLAPHDLLKNTKLAPLVEGKKDPVVPIVIQGVEHRVDFRFLRGNFISQKPEIELVTNLKELINASAKSINVVVGPSGSVKTRAQFDIARHIHCLYFEFPDSVGTVGSLDIFDMIQWLKNTTKYLSISQYHELSFINDLICVLIFSRVYYLGTIRNTVTPEKWLLMQLPTANHQSEIRKIFKFCVWLVSKFPAALAEMRHFLLSQPKTPVCIDETNNMFNTLLGVFKATSGTVAFIQPFLYGMFIEFQHPYILAGTKLRLQLLEEELSSLVAKFSDSERRLAKWTVVKNIEYITDKKAATRILCSFLNWKFGEDITSQIIGRARFLFEFLRKLFLLIMSVEKIEWATGTVEAIVQNEFNTFKCDVISNGPNSMVQSLVRIHNGAYSTVILSQDGENVMVNVPAILIKLAFGSIFRKGLYFAPIEAVVDLVSLGVCLLTWVEGKSAWCLGEPFAVEALLKFYAIKNIELGFNAIRDAILDVVQISGPKDYAKGKMLEWLAALRLKSLCGTSPLDLPIFKQAAATPNCPTWFNTCHLFNFKNMEADGNGELLVRVVFHTDDPDIIGVVPISVRCAFYSETSNEATWDNTHANFAAKAELNPIRTNGHIRLLITMPTKGKHDPVVSFEPRDTDVILRIDQANMQDFFAEREIALIRLFV